MYCATACGSTASTAASTAAVGSVASTSASAAAPAPNTDGSRLITVAVLPIAASASAYFGTGSAKIAAGLVLANTWRSRA